MPAGRTFVSPKTLCFSSKAYLLRLPFGVSITTWILVLSRSSDSNNDGFPRDAFTFFLPAIRISLSPIGTETTLSTAPARRMVMTVLQLWTPHRHLSSSDQRLTRFARGASRVLGLSVFFVLFRTGRGCRQALL